MNSPRNHPFRPGARYRVLQAFSSLDSFSDGESVVFAGSSYSAYDSCSGFDFLDARGKTKRWDMHDEDPDSLFAQLFEEIRNEN